MPTADPRITDRLNRAAESKRKRTVGSFQVRGQGEQIELLIFGPIGQTFDGVGVTAAEIVATLQENKAATHIDVFLNRPSGMVFDGLAIYKVLPVFPGNTCLDH